jgi:hypothetical protein
LCNKSCKTTRKVSPAPVGSKPLPSKGAKKPEDHETVKHRVPLLITTFWPHSLDFGRFNQRIFSRKLSCFLIIVITSTRFITSSKSGNAIHPKFMVSKTTNFGLVSIWSKTLLYYWMFPSITTSAFL